MKNKSAGTQLFYKKKKSSTISYSRDVHDAHSVVQHETWRWVPYGLKEVGIRPNNMVMCAISVVHKRKAEMNNSDAQTTYSSTNLPMSSYIICTYSHLLLLI